MLVIFFENLGILPSYSDFQPIKWDFMIVRVKTNKNQQRIGNMSAFQRYFSVKEKYYKTGVINNPLGQPTVPAGSDCRLLLKFWDGRTLCVKIVITTGRDCGRPCGSIFWNFCNFYSSWVWQNNFYYRSTSFLISPEKFKISLHLSSYFSSSFSSFLPFLYIFYFCQVFFFTFWACICSLKQEQTGKKKNPMAFLKLKLDFKKQMLKNVRILSVKMLRPFEILCDFSGHGSCHGSLI